jgi:hypothetical protein
LARRIFWKIGEELHGGVDPHLGPRANDGAVEHAKPRSKERAIAHRTACQVGTRANEYVVADDQRMPLDAADYGILHDDTLSADDDRAGLCRQHGAEPDRGVWTYRHVTADHRRWRESGPWHRWPGACPSARSAW